MRWSGAGPPLVPPPDEGRSLLRRELLDPGYHDQGRLQQVLDWLADVLDDGLRAAQGAPAVSTLVAMVLLVVVVLALGLLTSQADTSARSRSARGEVVTTERVTADELRARALSARHDGRHGDALLEAFRALARRQVERGLLPDDAGATAREVADVLAGAHVDRAARLRGAAGLFDGVLYGALPAGPEESAAVLDLDDDLAGVR